MLNQVVIAKNSKTVNNMAKKLVVASAKMN